jgi:hypothetical protein
MQTFGWNLLQFARAVDHLPFEVVDGMKDLASAYFLGDKGLNACYFCVHRPGAAFEGVPAFKTVWSSDPHTESQVVRRFSEFVDGKGSGSPSLRALAYNQDRCLWITAECVDESNETADGVTLDSASADLKDHWSEHPDPDEVLPRYVSLHGKPCQTLVALPLKHAADKLGVLVVEFSRVIPITAGARREAELLVQALGRILWLQDAAASQLEGTRKAFAELQSVIEASRSSLDPPTMFFAFSDRANSEVTDTIKRVVKEQHGSRLTLVSWDENDESGQITDYIVQKIFNSRYGICYLSEPNENPDPGELQYVDNDNVLIEAGMLQALKNSPLGSNAAWIPVREADELTGPMPFDFTVESRLVVPRDEEGKFQVEEFEAQLKGRLEFVLQK